MGNQVKFISYVQLIGIVLVVIGHSLHKYPVNYGMETLLYRMIYSFHMPMFFFVSGFLMIYTIKTKRRRSWSSFVFGKFKRLIIPFITLTTITFVPRALLSDYADDVIPLSLEYFAKAFILKDHLVIPYLWFLQALYVIFVAAFTLFIICEKIRLPEKWFYLIALSLAICLPVLFGCNLKFFSLGMFFKHSLYFVLGMFYARYFYFIDKFLPSRNVFFTLIWATIWSISFAIFENTHFTSICAVAGIMMCVGCSRQMEKYNWHFLDRLSGANYMIFLLSWYFAVFSQQFLSHFIVIPWYYYSILSITFGLAIPCWIYLMINNHPHNRLCYIISIMLGHKISKSHSTERKKPKEAC